MVTEIQQTSTLYVAFRGQRKLHRIATVNQASAMMRIARERSWRDGSEVPNLIIYGPNKQPIGYVSYNGRVWSGSPTDSPRTELVYDPTQNPFGRNREIQGGAIFVTSPCTLNHKIEDK